MRKPLMNANQRFYRRQRRQRRAELEIRNFRFQGPEWVREGNEKHKSRVLTSAATNKPRKEQMKIKESNDFETCPEFTGKSVCVDVTPLRKQQSQYGERNVFKIVFEVDADKKDGGRYGVWSNNFTPTLNEKASLRKFLRGWFGRDLSKTELEDFDTETLIGKPAQLVVVHQHKDGKVYANIAACTPDKSGEPLKPSGKVHSCEG